MSVFLKHSLPVYRQYNFKLSLLSLLCLIALTALGNNNDTAVYSTTYNKAKAYLAEGKKQKAIKQLKSIIHQNSFKHEAPLLLAYIYESDKNYSEAAKYFSMAIKSKPKEAFLYFSRGNCYFELKKYNLAVADYNTTIHYDSLFLGAYNNMALARIFNQGNNKEDIREEDFRMARDNLKKFEQNGAIVNVQVLQNLGLIYLYLFDFKSSENYFSRIIQLDSTHANAHFYKGLSNYYLRKYDEALYSFKQAEKWQYENKNQLAEFISFTTFVIEQLKLPHNKKP